MAEAREESATDTCGDPKNADRYIQLARLNLDNYSQRIGMLWKINFALWASLAIVTAFAWKEDLYVAGWEPWIVGAFAAAIHFWFLQRLCVSNEKDLDWFIYYKGQAEVAMGGGPDIARSRPVGKNGFGHYVWNGQPGERRWFAQTKIPLVLGPWIITVVLGIVSCLVVGRNDGRDELDGGQSLRRTVTVTETDEQGRTHTWSAESEQSSSEPGEAGQE